MSKTNYLCRLAGDIIFISAAKNVSGNLIGQSALRMKKATYSHVAITLDHGSIIHAMKGQGVIQEDIETILSQAKDRPIKVIRHIALDNGDSLHQELYKRVLYYHQESYNSKLFLNRKEGSSFCSELAAKAYSDIGIAITKRKPKNTLPLDIHTASDSDQWLDVTDLYLNDIYDETTNNTFSKMSEYHRYMNETIHEQAKKQRETLKLINKFNTTYGQPEQKLDIQPEYSNSKNT